MMDAFLFAGLPYMASVVLVAGSIYRYRANRFSYSSLSSQFLENRKLMFGSIPWHVGILILLLGHVLPIFLPGLWQSLTANFAILLCMETLGITAAFLALAGLAVLMYRRLTSPYIQAVSTVMDLVILGLLISQVLVGIAVATTCRWGAAWSTHTTTPYLWSLLALKPNLDLIVGLPAVVRFHVIVASTIFLLVPFSRLVHVFTVPITYLWRPPIKVVWTNARRFETLRPVMRAAAESRRHFLRGAAGVGAAATLLAMGVLDKLVRFFEGPVLTQEAQAEMLEKKLQRLELASKERELEIERLSNQYIFVAQVAELSELEGRYFTDYQMRPALAFKGPDGLPILISAKCTHLGCTVGNTLDNNGKILCPCHISYFDLRTGEPNPGAPAKAPLPRLGWVLMDPAGKLLASQGPDGTLEGAPIPEQLETYSVYIAKQFEDLA